MMAAATLCFHDVQLLDQPNAIHATISEVRTLPDEIKKRTHLYHYGDNWDAGPFDFVNQEFAGFAPPQERIRLFD